MKIYFSHSTYEYNTHIEEIHFNAIKKEFPNSIIINPKDIEIEKDDLKLLMSNYNSYLLMMEKYFYPQISCCDYLIAFGDSDGNLTDGVQKEIEYANKNKIPILVKVGNDWQKRNEEFYKKSNAYKFICDYFKVKKGVRCISGHPKYYSINNHSTRIDSFGRLTKFNPNQYLYKKDKRKMITLSEENLIYNNCLHSFMYVFDKKVLDWYTSFWALESKIQFPDISKVGINAVLDLDAPSNEKGRKDIFNHIPDFNSTIKIIDKYLEEISEDYNLMFSGNGIYIILKGYYDDINIYEDNLTDLIDVLKEKLISNKVTIDNAYIPWNDYFKIPFTFHEKKPRISCPLRKGELDAKWIKEHTDISNIKEDYSLIDEIIKEANWRKLW